MVKESFIAAIEQLDPVTGRLCMVSHPKDKCVIGVYSSLSYARKKAAIYDGGYVVRVYPNGFRKIYMN